MSVQAKMAIKCHDGLDEYIVHIDLSKIVAIEFKSKEYFKHPSVKCRLYADYGLSWDVTDDTCVGIWQRL